MPEVFLTIDTVPVIASKSGHQQSIGEQDSGKTFHQGCHYLLYLP